MILLILLAMVLAGGYFFWRAGSPQNGGDGIQHRQCSSATAFSSLAAGSADIGLASRSANERVLGLDGVAVIVNDTNPIDTLSKREVADIFSRTAGRWLPRGQRRVEIWVRN